MIESTVSNNKPKKVKAFPKLMRGIQTGTIYLALELDACAQTITCITLHQAKDTSTKVGSKNRYDAFLFEDFDGTLTLTNGD